MAPVGAGVASSYGVNSVLATLQKEPCDRTVVNKASTALQEAHATRAAAEMLKGFGYACGDANTELYRASELFFLLGDYESAIRASNRFVSPGTLFCSWSSSGQPNSLAASETGPLT